MKLRRLQSLVGPQWPGVEDATGTSGGNFALMTESVSLAGAAELGEFIYLNDRTGNRHADLDQSRRFVVCR